MSDYDVALATMDDDGFGCAIDTSLAEREQYAGTRAILEILAKRLGAAVPVTADMVSAVMAGLAGQDEDERHPDAYTYGEPWGPGNPAPGSSWSGSAA